MLGLYKGCLSKISISLSIALWFLDASAQQKLDTVPVEKRAHIEAQFTKDKITIDGKAKEAAWKRSKSVTHFIVAYPKQGAKASYDTEVQLLYDNTNLYVFARCYFPPGIKKIQVHNMQRDFGFSDNESFQVLIDPFKDPRLPVMSFCVSPFGTQTDIMHYNDGSSDYNWDTLWQAASDIQEHSWTTEIAIPFTSLRYPAKPSDWSINFARSIRERGEVSGWSPWPMAFSEARMEYAGIASHIVPPKASLNLRVEPYVLLRENSAAGTPRQARTKYTPLAGGEVKYAINNNTVLEATLNTDFSQASVDQQVINLSRSIVYYPEQRQFFLENSSLFSVGQNGLLQPFYSRRIGLSGNGSSLPLRGGIRLIHQDNKKSTGLIIMKQEGDSTAQGALFGVLRYKRNVSRTFQLGGMAVMRENLAGNNVHSNLNTVATADAFWRPKPSLTSRGMLSLSNNTLTHQTGSALFGELDYSSNTTFFDLLETVASPGYIPQTGFLAREDFINTHPYLSFNIHKKWFPKTISFFNPSISADVYNQASTAKWQEANFSVVPFALEFTNLARANITVTSSQENLSGAFSPVRHLNIAAKDYHFTHYDFYALSNQGARYSAEARLSLGGYYDGQLTSYHLSLRAAPSPRVSFSLGYTLNSFHHVGIGRNSTQTHLLAPQLRLAASKKLLFTAFYQYNTDARNGSLNARFSWEYKPLSFLYLVYNSSRYYYKTPFTLPQHEQNGVVKLTYIYQF